MQMDVGKYRGRELSEVPTDYLEAAPAHLRLSAEMWDAVMAERCRRANAERVQSETPLQQFLERPLRVFNRIVARVRLAWKARG